MASFKADAANFYGLNSKGSSGDIDYYIRTIRSEGYYQVGKVLSN